MENCPKIKANYSFWRHPVRWISERKTRKAMQTLLEFHYEHSNMKEEVMLAVKHALIYGHLPKINPTTQKKL